MRSLVILVAALITLIGAASADIYNGSASYQWNGAGLVNMALVANTGGAGSGSQTMTSGMAFNLYPAVSTTGSPAGNPVGTSTVDNTMTLSLTDFPYNLANPYAATQTGSNTLYLDNYQNPGSTVQNADFASTSTSGGVVDYASEGIGTATVGQGATFAATSTGVESSNGFLLKNIVATDTNQISSQAIPDAILAPSTTSTPVIIDHTVINEPTGQTALTMPSLHIKSGEFDWTCTDGSDVAIEDCFTKDRTFESGVTASASALGEASPTVNGLTGATAGMTITAGGGQTIGVQVTNPVITP